MMAEFGESDVPTAKRQRRSVYCNHCKQKVPPSTYYRHREQFFDVVSQRWTTGVDLAAEWSSDDDENGAPTQCGASTGTQF